MSNEKESMKKSSRFVLLYFFLLVCGATANENLLTIESEIDDLTVEINENPRGILSKNTPQVFIIEEGIGTGGFGFHRVIFHKELNATHELYGEKEFKYKPYEKIFVSQKKIQPRLKRALLAKENGLLHTIKLKHQYASHFELDDDYLYVLTQSRTKVYSKRTREANDAEYLEIYDRKTLSFIKEILLNNKDTDSFDRGIVLHQGIVYVTSKSGKVIFWEKKNLFTQAPKELPISLYELDKLRTGGEYLFRFGKGGMVEIYRQHLHVTTIDTKKHRFKGYKKLEDKRFDRVFDVLYIDGKLFIANDLGEVQVYRLASNSPTPVYLKSLRNTKIKDAYDVLDLALYGKSSLMVGTDKQGLYGYNLETLEPISHIPSIEQYSTIYQMNIAEDTLLFTQGIDFPSLEAYNMKEKMLVHHFEGEALGISDFKVKDIIAYTLDNGYLYGWDMSKIKTTNRLK